VKMKKSVNIVYLIYGNMNTKEWYETGAKYWSTIDCDDNGVLGGFAHLSPPDLKESEELLLKFLPGLEKKYAADCGAGIGRISKGLLLKHFEKVNLIEQNPQFLHKAKEILGEDRVQFTPLGLQDFIPEENKYDIIWIQWVLTHLTDTDFVLFLQRCKKGLKSSGIIVIKENISSGGFEVDTIDHSVTRSEQHFQALFNKSGLKLLEQRIQKDWLAHLFKVNMYVFQ